MSFNEQTITWDDDIIQIKDRDIALYHQLALIEIMFIEHK
jgi:hypothetical protein